MAWHGIWRFRLEGNFFRHRYKALCLNEWQRGAPQAVAFEVVLPLSATREVTLFARHDPAWMNGVVDDQSDQHRHRIENILIRFMVGDTAVETLRVFDQAENNSDLLLHR